MLPMIAAVAITTNKI